MTALKTIDWWVHPNNSCLWNLVSSITLTLSGFIVSVWNFFLQGLPLSFMRENGMNEPGTIALLGKDGNKWICNLLRESRGRMSLGKGWKEFAKANGLEIGVSFTLESIWEDAIPMLGLSSIDFKSDTRQQGECYSNHNEKESLSLWH